MRRVNDMTLIRTKATLVWIPFYQLNKFKSTLTPGQHVSIVSWINSKNQLGIYVYTDIPG